jgi:AmiR/NasT family two-component response regulator
MHVDENQAYRMIQKESMNKEVPKKEIVPGPLSGLSDDYMK